MNSNYAKVYTDSTGALIIEGELADIQFIASKFNHSMNVKLKNTGNYYFSKSKQQSVKISDMPGPYAKNALQKKLLENFTKYLEKGKTLEGDAYVKHLLTLPTAVVEEDPVVINLMIRCKEGTK